MRDLRDPQALGELLLNCSAKSSAQSICAVYDEELAGVAIPFYGESVESFHARSRISSTTNGWTISITEV
jgi:hypothetical protein